MDECPAPVLEVHFYATAAGSEPVHEWLRSLSKEDRKTIGGDIKTVEIGWPIGMPLVRKMERNLWEIRIDVPDGIVRVFFTLDGSRMVLVHGIKKKSTKTPKGDLELARTRMKEVHRG